MIKYTLAKNYLKLLISSLFTHGQLKILSLCRFIMYIYILILILWTIKEMTTQMLSCGYFLFFFEMDVLTLQSIGFCGCSCYYDNSYNSELLISDRLNSSH